MLSAPRRPELEGYPQAVAASKQEGRETGHGTSWFVVMAVALLWISLEARDWDTESWVPGMIFAAAVLCGLIALLLSFSIGFPHGVSKRLEIAMRLLADKMGWTWEATEVDKEGLPLTTGRLSGKAADLDFSMTTSKTQRELRFALPDRELDGPSSRDFYDLEEVEAERKRRSSLEGLPTKAGILSGHVGKALGRDRSATLDGDTLIIRCTPYKERGLAADANMNRRMREAEAILTLAEAIRDDWLADFDLS